MIVVMTTSNVPGIEILDILASDVQPGDCVHTYNLGSVVSVEPRVNDSTGSADVRLEIKMRMSTRTQHWDFSVETPMRVARPRMS